MTTAAVLLAAGGGTRFVGPSHKLLAPVAGRPLVAYALANMTSSGLIPRAVVTGAIDIAEVVPDDVVRLSNHEWESGMASSLAVAVRWARDLDLDAFVVGLADQPGITPDAWRAVADANATPIAVATYAGRRGHPVRLGAAMWDRLPVTGDVGARGVMQAAPELVTEVPCAGDPFDIDTVEDWRRWQ